MQLSQRTCAKPCASTPHFTQLNLLLEEGEALRFAMRNGGDGSLNDGMMLTVKSTAP